MVIFKRTSDNKEFALHPNWVVKIEPEGNVSSRIIYTDGASSAQTVVEGSFQEVVTRVKNG